MDATLTNTLPAQGQLVEVRRRHYVVTDIQQSTLPPMPLAGTSLLTQQHLVLLRSVEEDALGEELEVIWELEPGARVFERLALPAPLGFDPPRRLAAFLNAVRWGAIASADVQALQAPFRSGIDIEPYQLDPVVRALQMPRVNLLVADDVGLGKTIEAGLVAQELLIRHRARRILIVCPAALQLQWHDQMREKFGLEFRIVDSDLMRYLRRRRGLHVNPWAHFPRLITSMDYLKREQPLRLLREQLPPEGELSYPRPFDLLIVDEAHNVAPAGRGRYAIDSQRTAAIRTLTPHFEHKLFLSATPHNGYAESFSSLLELLDNQRFARGVPPEPEQLASVMIRRLKSELPPNWDGTPRFPPRHLAAIEVTYSEAERSAHHLLQRYTEARHQGLTDSAERTATEFVLKLLKKRLFSSPAAFRDTLAQHRTSLAEATRPIAARAGVRPKGGILQRLIEEVEEEYADDTRYEDATQGALQTTTQLFRLPSAEELALLDELSAWAERASLRPDSKAQELLAWLHSHIRPSDTWSEERVIIFTEYRATQKWLQELLAAHGLTKGERLLVLYGGMPDDQREAIKAAFQATPNASPVRILLATDAASEGIDLQRHCHRLIHYEIPWNPNRMEQRNGRIDRHGQTHSPLIYHFAPRGYEQHATQDIPVGELEGDLEFLMRAVRKVEQIREDLGKVGPVIADQVAEAMLGRRRDLQTTETEKQAGALRAFLRFERDLRARIERLHERLLESRQTLHLEPENVQDVVEIGLDLAGQLPLQEARLPGLWPDPTRVRCPVFHLPPLRGSWARAAEGLAHPHTHELRPIVFDHALARGRDDVVLVHLGHPLVQMALQLLRAEIWREGGQGALYRVTARLVPDHVMDTPAVIAHARLVIIGGDSHRLHEELISAGGELREGRFRRLNVTQAQTFLAAALPGEPSPVVKTRLQELWQRIEEPLLTSLEVRMRDRADSLQNLLANRAEKEASDIRALLEELARTIQKELSEATSYVQLELDLFSSTEREQYQRNLSALRARLSQIPEEIEQETAQVYARYRDPQPRMFPVAVEFLVPQKFA